MRKTSDATGAEKLNNSLDEANGPNISFESYGKILKIPETDMLEIREIFTKSGNGKNADPLSGEYFALLYFSLLEKTLFG